MPGYQFTVSLTLENTLKGSQVITIPRGTIIEPESTHLSFQSAVIARDYTFHLKPGEVRSVILEAECWNRQLSPPRGVPGKVTALKGDVGKHIDVWSVSSTPKSGTVLTSPSQDAHVFAALANTTPDMARSFLENAFEDARRNGVDGPDIDAAAHELGTLGSTNSLGARERQKLVGIARNPSIQPFVSAKQLRAFLVRTTGSEEPRMEALVRLSTDLFAVNSHRLAKAMYESAMELTELIEEQRMSIKEDRRLELGELARTKFISMLDSLPLLDEIPWNYT